MLDTLERIFAAARRRYLERDIARQRRTFTRAIRRQFKAAAKLDAMGKPQ